MNGKNGRPTFRERLSRFYEGRNGNDALGHTLSLTSLVVLIASLATGSVWEGILSNILWFLALALLAWSTFRMLSKNIYARQAENDKFLAFKRKLFGDKASRARKRAQRQQYRYFRCPKCKTKMRVPRGKGKVRITCVKCGNVFMGKT